MAKQIEKDLKKKIKDIFSKPQKSVEPQKEKSRKKALQACLLLVVFLIPLFFQITRVDIVDFNKQALLIVSCLVLLMVWLLSLIFEGSFELRFSFLHLIIFGLLAVAIIDTVFSRWQWGSFWGWPLNSESSLLSLLGFVIFYILVSNLFSKKNILSLELLIVASGFLVALIGILQLYGKFLLPFSGTKVTSFNTIGSVTSWGIFLQTLLPIVLALTLAKKTKFQSLLGLLGVSIFIGAFLCNYWLIWIGILISMAAFLIFGLWQYNQEKARILVIPLILFSLAIILGVLKIQLPNMVATPIEVSPSQGASLAVVREMLQTDTRSLLLGWGPGTFKYGWSQFKPSGLNQTIFWNLRFTKASSQILETLGEIGILGAAFYLIIIGLGLYFSIKELLIMQKKEKHSEWFLMLGVLAGFISLSVLKFLYPVNFTLEWFWWFLLAVLSVFFSKKKIEINLAQDSKTNFVFSFIVILAIVGSIFVFYLEGTRYLAEEKYAKILQVGADFPTAEKQLLEAVQLNPNQEIFLRDLAQIYLVRADQEIRRTDISNDDKITNTSQFVQNTVAVSRRATDINPVNVLNWQTRGDIYQNLIGLSDGASDWAINSYKEALKLEPNNPFIYLQIGKTYAAQASLVSGKPEARSLLTEAENYIKQAFDLKPDYADAIYQIALIYQAQDRRQEALDTLEALKQASPYLIGYDPLKDVGLAFQLGILYYQDEKYDQAQKELERAISLSPAYSNARYFLGLIYDKNGHTAKAIEQFQEIQKYNPDNTQIQQILANLQAGKPALQSSEVLPEQPPIEEQPKEAGE